MSTRPTPRTYTSLDAAYDHFNRELFGGQLPPCLITMQRHRGSYGYFAGGRFARVGGEEVADEIALNPAHFADRPAAEVLSTLVHEMVHLWQHHLGTPSRSGYHNKEWAAKMREAGLTPTASGEPGGKDTGQKMTHLIDPAGRFAAACTAWLAASPAILYHDRAAEGEAARARTKKKAASKTRYTCPGCEANAWAKPATKLICGECEEPMQAEEPEAETEAA